MSGAVRSLELPELDWEMTGRNRRRDYAQSNVAEADNAPAKFVFVTKPAMLSRPKENHTSAIEIGKWFERRLMLRSSVRSMPGLEKGSKDDLALEEIFVEFSELPIEDCDIVHDTGIFGITMYLSRGLKISCTCLTDSQTKNLGVSFFENGELLREDLMTAEEIAKVVKNVYQKLDE